MLTLVVTLRVENIGWLITFCVSTWRTDAGKGIEMNCGPKIGEP